MQNHKLERLNNAFMEQLNIIFGVEVKNEILKSVVVTAVDITNDLSFAKVYFTSLDDDKKKVASGNYNLREIDFLNMFFYDGQSLNDESKIETSSAEEIQELYSLYYGESNQEKDIVQMCKDSWRWQQYCDKL